MVSSSRDTHHGTSVSKALVPHLQHADGLFSFGMATLPCKIFTGPFLSFEMITSCLELSCHRGASTKFIQYSLDSKQQLCSLVYHFRLKGVLDPGGRWLGAHVLFFETNVF